MIIILFSIFRYIDKSENEYKYINSLFLVSLEENAACACAGPEMQDSCPLGGDLEKKCSGRGKCICGRCFCDLKPDPMHPSKVSSFLIEKIKL